MRSLRLRPLSLVALSLCAVSACGPNEGPQDSAMDSMSRADTTAQPDTRVNPNDSGSATPDADPPMDSGVSPQDSGARMDTGVPPMDSGVPPRDTGVPPTDSGVRVDTGVPPRDTGVPPTDSGTTACPAPPGGASANAVLAYNLTNNTRRAMGLQCQTMVTTINTAAQNHCNYYSANRGVPMCVANAHGEVMSCSMFTGASFSTRMTAAGYRGSPSFEVMAFVNNGTAATQMWIDSIWHRTPVLSPWTLDMGYGSATGCDTIDYGVGAGSSVPATTIATYPYANQTGVPVSFSGNEGPPPPPPPTGWPSGYPITIYFRGTIATHTLTVDGSATEIPHTWLAPGAPESMGLLSREFVMYAHRPLTAATRYRVRATGTAMGGGATSIDFVFTTR